MPDRRGIEGLWLTHPLRHQPLRTGIGHEPVMGRAAEVLLGTHRGALAVQRVIGIVNDDVLPLMMGSMQILCLAVPSRC
jgi:hypothetical protein